MTTETAPRQSIAAADEGGPLVVLRKQLEQRADEFQMVLPSHITPAKLQRTILTAAQANPDLLACDRRSFLTSCMKAAQDGLLPDGREAAIVPFKTRVKDAGGRWNEVRLAQYMPMVFGLRKKILQSGEIADLFAAVVYRQEIERNLFHYEEGSERILRHRPILDPDFAPTDDDIALVYSVATFADGSKSFEVMRRVDINRVRQASQTGATTDAKGEPREAKGPWRDWFPEMAKKTVIRRHSKSLPQSGDILLDVEADDMKLAAKSAAALLDSRRSEAPRQIATERFDPETGEVQREPVEPVIVAEGFDPGTERLRRKVEGEAEPPPDEPDEPAIVEPEINPPPPEPERPAEPPTVEGESLPDPAIAPEPDRSNWPEPEPETDQLGVSVTDADKMADEYIARARACETVIDLRKLTREAEPVLNEMEPEVAMVVDVEFANALKRLAPKKES
jgi:recombination protein RecT